MIFDKIHIMNGSDNTDKYLIYDAIKNTIEDHEVGWML